MLRKLFLVWSVLFACAASASTLAVVTTNPDTGLKSWKNADRGFSLELVQLLPEFVQAIYSSRDLPPAIFDSMRGYCVFGTVARNESNAPLSYRVADWRVVTEDGKKHSLRTKTQWIKVWAKLGADFSYSILPAEMTFEIGDWSQGFTTPKIAPGTRFDLIYTWRQHGKTYTDKLENLACPSGSDIR